jgi:excisionase family DNA binding protein
MNALLTVEQAAIELHISVSTLQHLTAKKCIGHFKLGRRVYLSSTDIENYMQSRRVEAQTLGGKP